MINSLDSCHDPVDEVLEVVWTLNEDGEAATAERITALNPRFTLEPALLEEMQRDGLLAVESGEYVFTDEGKTRAEGIIRSHRLAERLARGLSLAHP